MSYTLDFVQDAACIRLIAESTLLSLPDYFGVPESTAEYIRESAHMPVIACRADDQYVGFLSIKRNTPDSGEIYVMGVRPEYHRMGIGRALVAACEQYCREQGMQYLQVKTLDASHPDKGYARTRAFYRAVGFAALECMPELWGKETPCLVMVKKL